MMLAILRGRFDRCDVMDYVRKGKAWGDDNGVSTMTLLSKDNRGMLKIQTQIRKSGQHGRSVKE